VHFLFKVDPISSFVYFIFVLLKRQMHLLGRVHITTLIHNTRMIPNYRKGKQNGTLYNLQILSLNEQPHLLLCGEHGISLYKWNNLLSYISKNATYTYTISITQEESYTPHVLSPLERSFCHDDNYTHAEINSMSYCTTSSTLYGASGDGFGCYKWNLERGGTPVGTFGRGVVKGQGGRRSRKEGTTTRRGHEGYLHSVKVIPDSNMVLTGGDDGALVCVCFIFVFIFWSLFSNLCLFIH